MVEAELAARRQEGGHLGFENALAEEIALVFVEREGARVRVDRDVLAHRNGRAHRPIVTGADRKHRLDRVGARLSFRDVDRLPLVPLKAERGVEVGTGRERHCGIDGPAQHVAVVFYLPLGRVIEGLLQIAIAGQRCPEPIPEVAPQHHPDVDSVFIVIGGVVVFVFVALDPGGQFHLGLRQKPESGAEGEEHVAIQAAGALAGSLVREVVVGADAAHVARETQLDSPERLSLYVEREPIITSDAGVLGALRGRVFLDSGTGRAGFEAEIGVLARGVVARDRVRVRLVFVFPGHETG